MKRFFVKPVILLPKFFEGEGAAKYELAKDPSFLELKKLVTGLAGVVQQQVTSINGLRTTIEAGVKPKVEEEEEEEPTDLEAMPKKDFFDFMMKQVGGLLDTKLTEFGGKLDGTVKEFRTSKIRDEITSFAKDNPDFHEWETEIASLNKTHPTLGIRDLYMLAKDRNPDKVKELETKYAKKEDDAAKDDTLTLFGGYRPSTSKSTNGDGSKEAKKPTVDEALEQSWSEALDKFPSLAKMGDDALD